MKKLVGNVISDRPMLSAVVVVERSWSHPLYKKTVKRSKKYLVDNAAGAKVGDKVELIEGKPMSKRKRFTISNIMNK